VLEVERIGEAKNPGPGRFRAHRRGQRSLEAMISRQVRFLSKDAETTHGSRPDVAAFQEEEDTNPEFQLQALCVWHVNIQGLRSHAAELVARLRTSETSPHVICLNETFLDQSIGNVEIENYVLIERWDRAVEWGGVAIYAQQDFAQQVTFLDKSPLAERLWCVLHTDCGPYLLGAWYRPPSCEISSIESCEQEHEKLSEGVMGTLLLGDVNVHHVQWLRHSRETTAGGKRMRLAAAQMGLKQIVNQPTRGQHLLDLVLTDVPGATTRVLPKIADHSVVQVSAPLPMPHQETVTREGWKFNSADWERLNADLEEQNWETINAMTADDAAAYISDTVLCLAAKSIKKTIIKDTKSTHPWLNEAVLQAVDSKRAAVGTCQEAEQARCCSETIKREYNNWVAKVRSDLKDIAKGSKSWWTRERQLQLKAQKCCSIPALKGADGKWVRDREGKANLLAQTLCSKYNIADCDENDYLVLEDEQLAWLEDRASVLTTDAAFKIMQQLREDSATGPDQVPTRIIKRCAKALATPVYLLAILILRTGRWPTIYTVHWVACLHKKKVFTTQRTIEACI